jgi:ABC-type nitrate/sulfonate/bicarbonate transport system permease component
MVILFQVAISVIAVVAVVGVLGYLLDRSVSRHERGQ